MKEYIVPACEPGEEAWPITEFAVIRLVEKGLDPSTPVNASVESDSEAALWVGYYSNRGDWPPPDRKMTCTWMKGPYWSREEVPRDGYFPNGVGLLHLEHARGFGPPIPALVAFASAFLIVACGRDQPDIARAALAAGADPKARYIGVPEEWLPKRDAFVRDQCDLDAALESLPLSLAGTKQSGSCTEEERRRGGLAGAFRALLSAAKGIRG